MLIFHPAAVYVDNKRLFKRIQKQKNCSALHNPHIQLLHNLYTLRKLIYITHKRILEFCFVHSLH